MTPDQQKEIQRWRRRLRRIRFEMHQVTAGDRAGDVAISTPDDEDHAAVATFLDRYGWNALTYEAFRAAGFPIRTPYDLPPRLFFIRGPLTSWRELKGKVSPLEPPRKGSAGSQSVRGGSAAAGTPSARRLTTG